MNRQLLPWALCLALAAILIGQNAGELSGLFGSSAQAETINAESTTQPNVRQEPKAVYEADDLVKQRAESGRAYLPFLDIATMDLGIYSLPKDGTDGQSPHGKDEIYYVLSGNAKINIEGTQHAVKPGSIIFVAAGDEHKFEEIAEDLHLLVFFSKAKPAE